MSPKLTEVNVCVCVCVCVCVWELVDSLRWLCPSDTGAQPCFDVARLKARPGRKRQECQEDLVCLDSQRTQTQPEGSSVHLHYLFKSDLAER